MSELPRVFGGYVLLKSLGAGASGDVFLARPTDPNSRVPSPIVIKRLHRELASNRDFALRFRHEAELAVAVDSPHLAKIFEIGRVGDTYYMAMEYIAGWTVARVMTDLRQANHAATLPSIRDVMTGALEGLHILHTAKDESGSPLRIIHRDVSPKNIMIGEDSLTRLIDLGIGKSALQDWKTETGVVIGSPGYMAPEQTRGEAGIDHRADLYAMGVIFWEWLTGKFYVKRGPIPVMLASQAKPTFSEPSSHRTDIPKALDEIARRALALEPDQRFQSAKEFQIAVKAAIPDRADAQVAAAIVRSTLWGELGSQKTEMSQLLSAAELGLDSDEAPRENTVTYARRAKGGLKSEPLQVSPMQAPTFPAKLSSDLLPPARRGGIPIVWVVGMMGGTLALGLLLGAILLRPGTDVQIAAEVPLLQPVGTPIEEPKAPRIEASPVKTEPAEVAAAVVPTSGARKHSREARRDAPVEAAPAKPARDLDVGDLRALLKRAQILHSKAVEGSDADKRLTSLIIALAAEAAVKGELNQKRAHELESEVIKWEQR